MAGQLSAQAYKFSKIIIEGNSNIEVETIESYVGIDISQPVSAAALNNAFQRIFESGLFSSVEIIPVNSVLKILVEEFLESVT